MPGSTSGWYTVNAFGEGTDDVMGGQIQLQELSPAEVAKYLPAPVKLTYLQEGEASNEWEITDAGILQQCMEALHGGIAADDNRGAKRPARC